MDQQKGEYQPASHIKKYQEPIDLFRNLLNYLLPTFLLFPLLRIISGAKYSAVPTGVLVNSSGFLNNLLRPKSTILA